jgi:3-dehydroquinate synthase
MHTVAINIPVESAKEYAINIGVKLFDVNAWLPKRLFSQIVIITDNTVKKRAGFRLLTSLKQAGYDSLLLSFSAGEKHKNNKTKQNLENSMLAHRCDRDTLVLALGGGVVGDMAGFVAATYLRGIAYIQLPTTLLAMVDSSVGGKTGVNTPQGKNLIGMVYQPLCVVADIELLTTLPKKHRINGLVEALKMFLIHDVNSFNYASLHIAKIINGDVNVLKEIVIRSVDIKSAVVSRDEKEKGERVVLNFGHTIGHALEKISNYTLLHGHAVAYGILVEASISHLLGILESEQLDIIKKSLSQLGFYGRDLKELNVIDMIAATKNDKKAKGNQVRYILLNSIGRVHVNNGEYSHAVSDAIVEQAFKNIIIEE